MHSGNDLADGPDNGGRAVAAGGGPASAVPARAAHPPLTDLLQPLEALPSLAARAADDGDWLDVFLLGAAGVQVTEDLIAGPAAGAGHFWWWSQLSSELDAPGSGRQAVLSAARSAVGAAARMAERTEQGKALAAAAAAMADLRDAAAPVAAGLVSEPPTNLGSLVESATTAVGRLPGRARSEVLRLPSSFRSFDQYPEDIGVLVERAAQRWPDRSRPVVAVGVRTSGSYLAPLAAAYLRALGYRDVAVATSRPGAVPSAAARRALERVTAGPGLALVVDDPPVSGRSIARVTAQLERMGAPADALVLLLALAGPGTAPDRALERYPSVTLEWPEWHVHQLLAPARVASVLERLAGGYRVASCVGRPQKDAARRGHVLARYDVVLLPEGSGVPEPAELVVEGGGLGMFGRYAVAVDRALGPAVTPLLGVVDGLAYRLEPAGGWRAGDLTSPGAPAAVAAYVKRRQEALPALSDRSQAMGGRLPVWEAVSRALAPALGRPEPLLRPALLAKFTHDLLAAPVPSVVDGSMAATNWHDGAGGLVKKEAATGAFWNFDLACYDATYDMAAAAVQADLAELGQEATALAALRAGAPGSQGETSLPWSPGVATSRYAQAWEEVTGAPLDEERWLAYRLAHLWDLQRRGQVDWELWTRSASRAVNSYMAAAYLADLAPLSQPHQGSTPCAVDLDGCLEGGALGFSAVTGPSVLALRALRAHGVPVLLATGRSLGETAERCATFGLHGAAAEYGTVAYRSADRAATAIVGAEALDAMEDLRRRLSQRRGVEVSLFHAYTVRARRAGTGPGRRLRPEDVADLDGPWRVVAGYNQTDIVPTGADKLEALQVLAGTGFRAGTGFGAGTGPQRQHPVLSLAIGDSASDLAMLRAARLGAAPANCDEEVRRSGVTVLRTGYQDAVAEAVGSLLGHRPGTCAKCRAPAMSPSRRRLSALLSTHSGGRRNIGALLAELAGTWGPRR